MHLAYMPFEIQMNRNTFSNGIPYFFSIEGEIRVILCLKKASQF